MRAKLTLADRVFHCAACGFGPINRDVNAARNIAANAAVAPGTGETLNARRAAEGSPPLCEARVYHAKDQGIPAKLSRPTAASIIDPSTKPAANLDAQNCP